jgi:hypothetical protein
MDRHNSPMVTTLEKMRNFFPISSDQIHDSRPSGAQPIGPHNTRLAHGETKAGAAIDEERCYVFEDQLRSSELHR